MAEIRRAPTRRADNLVSDLLMQARSLSMHGHVCAGLARSFRGLQLKLWGGLSLGVTLAVVGAVLSRQAAQWTTPMIFAAIAVLLAVAGWFGVRHALQYQQSRISCPEGLDPFFEATYRKELSWHDRADLRALWERVRPKVLNSLRLLGGPKLPGGFGFRRQLRRLDGLVETDIPKMRRRLAPQSETEPAQG